MFIKNKYLFIFLLLFSVNSKAAITLICSIKGYEENSSGRLKIDEEVTVVVDEFKFLSIDVEGSDSVSALLMDIKYKNINKITNLSNKEKWSLRNEGSNSTNENIDKNISINRLTGLISYSDRYGDLLVTYSGKCKKVKSNDIKF